MRELAKYPSMVKEQLLPCKLAVASSLSKADFYMSALITQAIPLAAKPMKCNSFDWLHSLRTNMHPVLYT